MHKRFLTPTVSTLGFGALSIVITVVLLLLSESVLEDSLTAIGFPICFYYGFTGLACALYYRRELTESAAQLPAARRRPGARRPDAVRRSGSRR